MAQPPAARKSTEGIEPSAARIRVLRKPYDHPFFSFNHTYAELSAQEEGARVSLRATRGQPGRVEYESFDALMSGRLFLQAAEEMQKIFWRQLGELFTPFASLMQPMFKTPGKQGR